MVHTVIKLVYMLQTVALKKRLHLGDFNVNITDSPYLLVYFKSVKKTNSPADNCKISKKTAFYGTSMKLARNEEETHTSDFR